MKIPFEKKKLIFIVLFFIVSFIISCSSLTGNSFFNSPNPFENLSENLSNLSDKLYSMNNNNAAEALSSASEKVLAADINNQEIESAIQPAILHVFAAENAITSDAVFDKHLIPPVLRTSQRALYDAAGDLNNASEVANTNGHLRVSTLLYDAGVRVSDAARAIYGKN